MKIYTLVFILIIVALFTPFYIPLAQVELPADAERHLDQSIEEALPALEKEAEKAAPGERALWNIIITILKGPYTLLKLLIGMFTIVYDPSKSVHYFGPQVFGVDCTGQNYRVIAIDPPDEPSPDPKNKTVSVPLDPNRFKTVSVNGKNSACKWSGSFGENEYAFCDTTIPVTSQEIEVQLIDSRGETGSGMSGSCHKGDLPEKPF